MAGLISAFWTRSYAYPALTPVGAVRWPDHDAAGMGERLLLA